MTTPLTTCPMCGKLGLLRNYRDGSRAMIHTTGKKIPNATACVLMPAWASKETKATGARP